MLEVAKKYITDKKELKLTEDVINQYEKEKKIGKLNLNLEHVIIDNCGVIDHFEMDFKEGITFIQGDRNSGKSFAMEAFLYALSGNSRSTNDIVGEYEKKMLLELAFNKDLKITWKVGTKTRDLKMIKKVKDEEFPVVLKITELKPKLKEYIGLDPDLLTSTIYYSPKLSSQFSRMMPFQREELLIKIARLDDWLELESFTKDLKKKEQQKVDEINGVIGYLSELEYDKKELEDMVGQIDKAVETIDKDLKSIEAPDVIKLNNEYKGIRNQLNSVEITRGAIETYNGYEENLKLNQDQLIEREKELENFNNKIKDLSSIQNKKEQLEKNLVEIENDGKHLAKNIEENQKMLGNPVCPILNKPCDDLKGHYSHLQDSIANMNKEKEELRNKYQEIKKELDVVTIQYNELNSINLSLEVLKTSIVTINSEIDRYKKEISKIDIDKLRRELSKHDNDLEDQLTELEEKIDQVNKKIQEVEEEKEDLQNDKINKLAEKKDYHEKISQLVKMEKFIKEKTKLENRQNVFDQLISHFGKKGIPKKETKNILTKLNSIMANVINKISNNTMTMKLDDQFNMSVTIPHVKRPISPMTTSLGEEHVLNLAFVLSLGMFVFKEKMPCFFADDVAAFQPDHTAKDIISGLTELKKENKIHQLYMCSNRLKNLKITNVADRIIEFEKGNAKIK